MLERDRLDCTKISTLKTKHGMSWVLILPWKHNGYLISNTGCDTFPKSLHFWMFLLLCSQTKWPMLLTSRTHIFWQSNQHLCSLHWRWVCLGIHYGVQECALGFHHFRALSDCPFVSFSLSEHSDRTLDALSKEWGWSKRSALTLTTAVKHPS